MRYLLFSVLVLSGCASEYKTLRRIGTEPACVPTFQPRGLSTSWYDAGVDVAGKHISGLLLVKNMPEGSIRLIFTNEAGVTFFDFEFSDNQSFKVHKVMRQLDRKPVLKVLSRDFALILQRYFRGKPAQTFENQLGQLYFAYPAGNETAYLIVASDCVSLEGFQMGSRRKRKTSVVYYGNDVISPDSIHLKHHTFNMDIKLRKLPAHHVTE
jgi:hypothetical protein